VNPPPPAPVVVLPPPKLPKPVEVVADDEAGVVEDLFAKLNPPEAPGVTAPPPKLNLPRECECKDLSKNEKVVSSTCSSSCTRQRR
jgi:hypothetical protein